MDTVAWDDREGVRWIQLEGELEEGSWLVVEARDTDLLSPVPERLWREVLLRQDDDVRLLATYPDDPGLN